MSNRNRLPIDPLYHVEAQSLKRHEARRIGRHSLPAFERAALYPVDRFELERRQARELFWLDCVVALVFIGIAVCLALVVLGA